MDTDRSKMLTYFAWFISLGAIAGSLFFSQVLKFPPCVLCWYQRIFMYPLAIIIGVGILRKESRLYQYVLPMSLIGLGISIYHNLLYYKIIPDTLAPCSLGVSCTTKFIEYFGFITIPLLSFVAFLLVTVFMLMVRKIDNSPKQKTL